MTAVAVLSRLRAGDVTFTSWETGPPVALCTDLDSDSPCTGTPWTKEH